MGAPQPYLSKRLFMMRCDVALAACLFFSFTLQLTIAFVPTSRLPKQNRLMNDLKIEPVVVIRGSSAQQKSGLFISLDDSWNDLEVIVNKVSSPVELEKVLQATKAQLQWAAPLSKEWLLALENLAVSLGQWYGQLDLLQQSSLVLIPVILSVTSALYALSFPLEDYRSGLEPFRRGEPYDPIQARVFYAKHPRVVLQRALQLLRLSNKYLIEILLDRYVFKLPENDVRFERREEQRADELLQLITKLGPTAIKVGQALSVRPDLISAPYANALSTLQDQVPPFDAEKARSLLQKELGNKFQNLRTLNLEKGPVASASIGQVYKGMLNNKAVAVKVQRPNVLNEIALDLYIVREFAPLYQKLTGTSTDLQALAETWGKGFLAELDYIQESQSTIRFTQEMQARNLFAVTAPTVVEDYCTSQVLTTEWVEGTRLDESDAEDVPRLCSVALNAYLVMLLELRSLHCDPHPGNLLRTTDGRLCILDFGMTLDTDPMLQYSLLEFVAHLTSEDYEKVPDDLVKLGFIKPGKLEFMRRSGVLEPLVYFLRQAGKGGGAKGTRERIFADYRERFPGMSDDELRVEMRADMRKQMEEVQKRESAVTGITMKVEEIQRQNQDAFTIPPWFLYTSRAFLTLEGVSLQADPNYSIIKSCFPYVAKRLLGDDSPRAQEALRDLLFGPTQKLNTKRLSELADGFSKYTITSKTLNRQPLNVATKASETSSEMVFSQPIVPSVTVSTKTENQLRKAKLIEAEAAVTLAKDSADVLLAPNGNFVQNLLLTESALAASAQVKDQLKNSLVDGPRRFRDSLPLGMGNILPPLPFEDQVAPFLQKTEDEEKAQALIELITNAVRAQSSPLPSSSSSSLSPSSSATASAALTLIRSSTEQSEPQQQQQQVNGDSDSSNGLTKLRESLRKLDPEQTAVIAKELRENLPRYAPLLGQLGGKFASTLLQTASHNIESTLDELEQQGKPPDESFRLAVKGISNAAQRGATAISDRVEQSKSAN